MLKEKNLTKFINDNTYLNYYHQLNLMAKAVFEWHGLPNGIKEEWIENYLFSCGECMMFKDDELGLIVTKCAQDRGLNLYDEPVALTPTATGYTNSKSYGVGTECIRLKNNDMCIPTDQFVKLYAYRLMEVTRTADVNIHAQKTPLIITTGEKQRLTLTNVYNQYDGYKPVIFGDKSLQTDSIKVLKTDAPIVFDKLRLEKHALWNEAMTVLGINNANQDKKERLVDDEVQANNQQVLMNGYLMLKAREQACEDMNRLFGLNVSVKFRIEPMVQEEPSEVLGGEDNV